MTRKALGRGLDALIPRPSSVEPSASVVPPPSATAAPVPDGKIRVDRIRPNPWQPRRSSDPVRMDELVRSIEAKGVLEPLLVRRLGDGYELVAGERRLRAAQRAGLEEVPAIIVEIDDKASLEIALIENLQREDLNPVDEARAYRMLMDEFGRTHDQIAEQVGKDRSTVTNLIRILRLPEEVLSSIESGSLSAGHARCLLSLELAADQRRWAARILQESWSVRETEQRIAKTRAGDDGLDPAPGSRPIAAKDPHILRVEEAIRRRVGTGVRLRPNPRGGGRLEFHCADRDDLERLLDLLGVQVH